jgi:phage terminase small subunit
VAAPTRKKRKTRKPTRAAKAAKPFPGSPPPEPPTPKHAAPSLLEELEISHRLFVLEYLANGRNGVRAYLAAYPNCTSYGAAGVEAHRLLKNPKVRKALEHELRASFRRLHMDADEALALVSLSGRADIGDAYGEKGELLPVHQWPDSLRLAVKGIKPGPFGDTITLHDGLRARELMGIAGGRFKQQHEHKHRVSLAKLLSDEPLDDLEE